MRVRHPAAIGSCGAGTLILGYFLNQRGLLVSEGWRYPAVNLAGSVLVMISLLYHPNPPSIVIELFSSSISLYGIGRNIRRRTRRTSRNPTSRLSRSEHLRRHRLRHPAASGERRLVQEQRRLPQRRRLARQAEQQPLLHRLGHRELAGS